VTGDCGSLEVEADDENEAGKLARRLLWARDFRLRRLAKRAAHPTVSSPKKFVCTLIFPYFPHSDRVRSGGSI
jgi:hypothetical protein